MAADGQVVVGSGGVQEGTALCSASRSVSSHLQVFIVLLTMTTGA